MRFLLRQHLALDQRLRQRLVVRLDQRRTADAEIDGRRTALPVVERLGPLEAVEIFVDVDVVVRHVQPPQQTLRAARVFAPVGAVDSNHECTVCRMITVR